MISIFDKLRPVKPLTPSGMNRDEARALSEACLWCASQPLTAIAEETPDQQRRRSLFVESAELYQEAYRRNEKYGGPLHERAQALSKEADYNSLILLRSQLRTLSLNPGDVGELISTSRFQSGVERVIEQRAHSLAALVKDAHADHCQGGRLLHYEPYENLTDGASEYSSNGFFDVNDAPPWDTWVSFDGRKLISWVPPVLIPLAQAGLDANAVDCIRWADSTPFDWGLQEKK